jgi:hypothetical protein
MPLNGELFEWVFGDHFTVTDYILQSSFPETSVNIMVR